MGLDSIDMFYRHNPETQLGFVDASASETRTRRAFERLEQMADGYKVRWYGVAAWDGFRKGALKLPGLVEIAREVCGPDHRFRFIQLPFHTANDDVHRRAGQRAGSHRAPRSRRSGQWSADARAVIGQMPGGVTRMIPALETSARHAVQFSRSAAGISVALAGMSHRQHALENPGIVRIPPVSPDAYLRFFQ